MDPQQSDQPDNETPAARGWLRMPAKPADPDATAPLAAVDPAQGWMHLEAPGPDEPTHTIASTTVEVPANADVLPEDKSRFRLPRPSLNGLSTRARILAAVLAGALLLSLAGAAYATYDYSREYDGMILPGATIAGVDVGGMTEDEAVAAVRGAIGPELDRTISVTWGDRTWDVTPRELGAHGDAAAAVRAALDASEEASFVDLMQMRVFGAELDYDRSVAISKPRKGALGFVEGLASSVDRDPRDAAIDYSTGWVKLIKEKEGREVRVDPSRRALMAALKTGADAAELKVDVTKPADTGENFDQILLLRIGENKLYLYEDGKITHEWLVATGQPEYPTPTGEYEIELKRYMPTWVNPDPEGWGASMPAMIPPGVGNPLGVRALNWTAPAIRFHGTSAVYSLGYNASHGCVRMSNEDVIELYDMIDVGTPIVSTIVAPLRPMYVSAPDPTVVQEDSGESAPEADADDAAQERDSGNGNGDD